MKAWNAISKDPNAPEVIAARRTALVAARAESLIANRISYLCNLVKGKDILDIGVVEHTHEAINSDEWLHKHLCKAANTCLGVDIIEEEVNYLRQLGFNVICADLTKDPLNQKFDVIILGEVLEHLNAPGHLLATASKMLNSEGRLIVSVPNPWYINVIIKTIVNGSPYIDNADHVSWFDPCTIYELGQRHNLVLKRFAGIAVSNTDKFLTKILFQLTPFFIKLGVRAETFAKTMIYEFVLED